MKKKFLIIIPLIIIIMFGVLITKSEAAYKTNDPTVQSGGTITITVTSTTSLENYDLALKSYTGLTYVTCSSSNPVAVANPGVGKISFASMTPTTTLGTYTFKAPEVTQTTKYTVVFDVDGVTNKSTVTVNPKVTTPSGGGTTTTTKATMTKVSIGGKSYKPKDYTVNATVTSDVTSVKIKPTISNGESYKIDKGNIVKLEEGKNTVKVTLASGNVYTLNITRAAIEKDQPNVQDEDVTPLLQSLSIKGVKEESKEKVDIPYTPEFSSEVYEYKVALGEEFADITKLDIKAVGANGDFKVEITGNEELKDGENVITITVKTKNDSKVTTYKIIVTKGVETEVIETVAEQEDGYQLPEPEQIKPFWNETQSMIVIIFTSIVAILGIVFAVVEYNYTKKHKSEEPHIPYAGINTESEDSGMSEKENKKKEKAAKKELKKDEDKKGKHF